MNMKKESKWKALLEKYPALVSKLRFKMPECGEGWYDIIDEFYSKLEAHLKGDPNCKATPLIIKEKIGGLRIQGLDFDEEVEKLIEEVCTKAHHTCETCGSQDETVYRRSVGPGWITTVCSACAQKYHS